MLTALALAVQANEALRAEKVHAVLTQDRGVVVLALQAHQAIDHTLQVVAQVRAGSIPGMDVHEALVGVEQTTLHALARRNAILECSTYQLLHVRCDVGSSLSSGVRAIEAILTEVILALLALEHRGTVLALLAHYNCRGLSDDVHLVLLLANLPQELHRILQVLYDAAQVQLLLYVGLNRLLHNAKEEELFLAFHTKYPGETLNHLRCCWW
mmetsp:Transcript_64946/g.155067  ORF Transcript_64946/g.155067 Transcript_64946/m.155067 type:complete len:212 (-) Transcript_64946:455-1090(-)